MDDECLCLKWNNHGETYQQMLNLLRIQNILTDCTLACDGQKFSVHRLVLVTCSDFFRSLLGDVPCQHPIIFLRGISGKDMQALIDFMYIGKIDVPQREVPDLLSTAEILQIKGLGVLNTGQPNKNESKHGPGKRKRVHNTNSESLGTSQVEKVSSPLHKRGAAAVATETHCSDKDYIASKVSRRDWMRNVSGGTEESPASTASLPSANDMYYAQNTDKMDCFPKPESILSSIFKSSPIHSNPSSCDDPMDSSSNSYTVSIANSSPKEGLPLLTSLQSNPPKYSNFSNNYYGNKTGSTHHSAANASLYLNELPLVGADHGLINPSDVKEEAVDYTRPVLATDIPSLPSQCRKDSQSRTDPSVPLPKHDSSHFLDNLAPSHNIPVSYSQDENSENGADSVRPYLCPICRKSFAKVAILKRHHLAHFRPYNCHLCPRSFTRREVLAEHMLEHNGADLRLPCPVCNMTIKRKRNLQAHIKVKHPDYFKEKSANNEALC